MNKILTLMIAMLMSISISSFAGTRTNTVNNKVPERTTVPANIIIKQTITFNGGKTIVVFYEKRGENCKLYSTSDINRYGMADIYRIKSTNFERTTHIEGKCYTSKTVSALISMAREFLK